MPRRQAKLAERRCRTARNEAWSPNHRKIRSVTRRPDARNPDNGSGRSSTKDLASRATAALRRVVDEGRGQDPRRDSLTGLFDNRTLHHALTDAIEATNRAGGDIGLLFLDLDHFKHVNDRHGHVIGSRILSQVAALLDAAAKHAGGFAARYGGDEFALVLPGADLGRSLGHAERLRSDLAATILAGGGGPEQRPLVNLTCSIGAASLRRKAGCQEGGSLSAGAAAMRLLQLADDAMYKAKKAGRNRVAAADTEVTGAA